MGNNFIHGLTLKDKEGKTKAHPLYWVWHAKRKQYTLDPAWEYEGDFFEWCMANGWEKGTQIRRHDTTLPYGPDNCYVHVPKRKKGVLSENV